MDLDVIAAQKRRAGGRGSWEPRGESTGPINRLSLEAAAKHWETEVPPKPCQQMRGINPDTAPAVAMNRGRGDGRCRPTPGPAVGGGRDARRCLSQEEPGPGMLRALGAHGPRGELPTRAQPANTELPPAPRPQGSSTAQARNPHSGQETGLPTATQHLTPKAGPLLLMTCLDALPEEPPGPWDPGGGGSGRAGP